MNDRERIAQVAHFFERIAWTKKQAIRSEIEFPALLNNYCILASYLEASVSCHILFTYAIYV